MKFTKKEIDEIKDTLENSLKYYQDLLDDAPSYPKTKKRISNMRAPESKLLNQ
jgi:hypothetical protein